MHESNTFLLQNTPLKPLGQWGQTTPKSTPSHWGTRTPSNTWMPAVTPLTTPNNSSIGSRTSAQLCNKGPIGYSGMPQIHLKNCPFPFDNNHPSNKAILRPTPLTNPNSIRIQSSILPQYTLWTDQQTNRWIDRPTDGQMVQANVQ